MFKELPPKVSKKNVAKVRLKMKNVSKKPIRKQEEIINKENPILRKYLWYHAVNSILANSPERLIEVLC